MTRHDNKIRGAFAHSQRARESVVASSKFAGRASAVAPATTLSAARTTRTLAASSGRAPKRTSAPAGTAKSAVKPASDDQSRADLQRQLFEAEARILELEARLNGVTDRIAWIADRLHAVLDEGQ
jgi:hypothetical protein